MPDLRVVSVSTGQPIPASRSSARPARILSPDRRTTQLIAEAGGCASEEIECQKVNEN